MRFATATRFHRKSGGAKPRDLRFNGPIMEMFFYPDRSAADAEHPGPREITIRKPGAIPFPRPPPPSETS
jgi:hypothetical protein